MAGAHPSILALAGAHFDRRNLYLLQELAPGGSVRTLLDTRGALRK